MTLNQFVSKTDPGRRRRNNEDVFVCEPPLFAIADGMGGAQAGEVASGLAAQALKKGGGTGTPEERVNTLIQSANRLVYERAHEDTALTGMGTTLTLALVGAGSVTFGHVGDSRAYRLREGKLEQITQDHSLVAELTRAGKLSEEEAETHPQRSVITRALGTDADVDGDIFTVETREGDIFLLCSDGLTDMVGDQAIEEILEKQRASLKKAAQELVKAANRGGGEDNITVLLFEIGEISDTEEEEVPPSEPAEDDEDTLSGLEGIPVIEARPDEWAVDGDVPDAGLEPRPERARRRHRVYWIAAVLVLLAIIGLGLFGLSQSHFVGAQKNGRVAVYQGLPYNIAGIHLYRTVYVSRVLAAQLTRTERRRLFDHSLRSFGSARTAIRRYEEEIPP
jgi:serine/threonine protein phosphatase PrpC